VIDRFTRWRTTSVLFLAQSLFTAAVIASFTLSPVIAADLSGREGAAGLPTTITLVGRAAMAYPAGWLMDRAGRRLGLSLGFILGAAGGLVSVLAIVQGSFPIFLAGALLLGVMRGTAEQGRYAAAEVYPVSRRARIIGIIVFAGTLGAIGGPLLVDPSGDLVVSWGLPAAAGPFVATAVLLALALALIFLMLRPDPAHLRHLVEDADTEEKAEVAVTLPVAAILRRPAVQLAFAALVIGQLVMTMLMVITPLYMDHQQHGAELISWVMGATLPFLPVGRCWRFRPSWRRPSPACRCWRWPSFYWAWAGTSPLLPAHPFSPTPSAPKSRVGCRAPARWSWGWQRGRAASAPASSSSRLGSCCRRPWASPSLSPLWASRCCPGRYKGWCSAQTLSVPSGRARPLPGPCADRYVSPLEANDRQDQKYDDGAEQRQERARFNLPAQNVRSIVIIKGKERLDRP